MTLSRRARRTMRSRFRVAQASDGFSMIELMVSILIFGVLSAAVLTTLNMTIGLTRADRNRVAASNLAARELDIVRRDFNSASLGPQSIPPGAVTNPHPLPGGTVGGPLKVDNVPYTVVRTAEWTTAGSGTSACDDGSTAELTILKVHIDVTWTKMGGISPIVADTLLAPHKGEYSTATGFAAVKVLDRNGVASAGRAVTISGPSGTQSGTTAADGCILFPYLAAGTYTVGLNSPGYVDRQGDSTPTLSAVVVAAGIWKGGFDYDIAGAIKATFVGSTGTSIYGTYNYTLPTVMDLSLDVSNGGLLPAGVIRREGTGAVRNITGLFPYPGGYQLWGGKCAASDPATSWDARADAVSVTPNTTTAANVDLAQVLTGVVKFGVPQANVAVEALAYPDSSCPGDPAYFYFGDRIQMGSTDGSGLLARSLPYGKWIIYTPAHTPQVGTTWPVLTLRRSAPPVLGVAPIAVQS